MSVSPETRVLCADLRWIRADAVTAGTDVVGFDELPPGGKGARRKWRKSAVSKVEYGTAERLRIVTESSTVIVDPDQQLLCTARAATGAARGMGIQARSESPDVPGYGQRWVRAGRIMEGDRVVLLCAPWDVGETHRHGYLKGISRRRRMGRCERRQDRHRSKPWACARRDRAGARRARLRCAARQHRRQEQGEGVVGLRHWAMPPLPR